MRVTRPRLEILKLLAGRGGHLSADHLRTALKELGVRLSRASIYNVLRDLAQQGLIRVADAGPGPALYEYSGTPHDHFVCYVCGEVIDIPSSEHERSFLQAKAPPGFQVTEMQIVFRGICPDCRGKQVDSGELARAR
ncbi:MAG: Fur family transcriptional regulator [Acidobacteriota bacterium]